MKRTLVVALLFVATFSAPVHAAFVLNCTTRLADDGRPHTLPTQWKWDGQSLQTIETSPTHQVGSSTAVPVRFLRTEFKGPSPAVSLAFMLNAVNLQQQAARTYLVSGTPPKVIAAEILAIVSPDGMVKNAARTEYRNCNFWED